MLGFNPVVQVLVLLYIQEVMTFSHITLQHSFKSSQNYDNEITDLTEDNHTSAKNLLFMLKNIFSTSCNLEQ